jgi:hypothetical protein
MFDTEKYIASFAGAYETSGHDVNVALSTIKQDGATAITTIIVLKRCLGISTSEADSLVLNSRLWDTNGAIGLRKTLYDILNEEE